MDPEQIESQLIKARENELNGGRIWWVGQVHT